MDDSLLNAVLIVMGVNFILWFGQAAALAMVPEGPQFYSCKDTVMGELEMNNCQGSELILKDDNPASLLPTEGSDVISGSGDVYSDTSSSLLGWITKNTGLNYLYDILSAPAHFLKAVGWPGAVAGGLAIMWYGATLLLILAFIFGR